jgi:hypothetical protein
MAWNKDPSKNKTCVDKIISVYHTKDPIQRYRLALGIITAESAIGESDRSTEYMGTVAMAAIYPETYLKMEQEAEAYEAAREAVAAEKTL